MSRPRKNNPDHTRRHNMPAPSSEAIEAYLGELLSPLVYKQLTFYRQLGRRDRILGLPLMVAAVLTMLWRQVPSVRELCRLLNREDLLWCQAIKISQQALSKRFLEFPAPLFEQVLWDLLRQLRRCWFTRRRRPLPTSVAWVQQRFKRILVVDGSTLEALFRKLKSLQEKPITLAGKIYTIVDMVSHLPMAISFDENPFAGDTNQWEWLKEHLPKGGLLIFDRGFYDFTQFAALVEAGSAWITRLKKASYEVKKTFSNSANLIDQLIVLGHKRGKAKPITVRLIQVRHGSTWYRYITSVLDPRELPPYVVADLYDRRWQIETAFCLVKRLLNLAYLWTGSLNGVKLQVWATWLFYAVLLDKADAVADALELPTERISKEMLFRGFYHFTVASTSGNNQSLVEYLCDPKNKDLGIVKTKRKDKRFQELDLSPFPDLTFATSS